MRRAFLLTLALLIHASSPAFAYSQEKPKAETPAKAPEKSPAKTPEKAPEKTDDKAPPSEAPAPAAAPSFTADLVDGVRLIGQPIDLATLPLKTDFARLDIPLPLITSAAFNKDRTQLQVRLKNGDLISGVLELERIRLRTAYGEATIPIAKLATVTVKSAP